MLYTNAKQRMAVVACLFLIAIVFLFPPYQQVNTMVDLHLNVLGTETKWVGFSFLWETPPQPGRRGGPVRIDRGVLVAEVAGILILMTTLAVWLRGFPKGCCQRCGYDLRGHRPADRAICPECGHIEPLS